MVTRQTWKSVWRLGRLLITLLLAGCGEGGEALTATASAESTPGHAYYLDPTADLSGRVEIGDDVYVAPFARMDAESGRIALGRGCNVQDNALLHADQGRNVLLGDNIICAHGCSVEGPAILGSEDGDPVFVGFNARIEASVVQPGAAIGILSHLGPGVVLRSGMAILPGRSVDTQAEADDPGLGKVVPLTSDLRHLFEEILHVNEDLARGYSHSHARGYLTAQGISENPLTDLHPSPQQPVLDQQPTLEPAFRNRVIGHVVMEDPVTALDRVMGHRISLRADEGSPFRLGTLSKMEDEVTMHALEGSEIEVGDNCSFGWHSVVHGGPDDGNSPNHLTRIGDEVQVGDEAVVFRSAVGDGCIIGERALIDGSQLAPGTVVPPRTIIIDNQVVGLVDW
jgi:carbonic anhydrase/acetyltransferase-like protein (isoleucine patch superfamily)